VLPETIPIESIREEHIESFHKALDMVSRERKYLSFLEAPPLEDVRPFVLDNIENGHPQVVAVVDGEVVGWCDIRRHPRPTAAHCGTLGMGIIPGYREKGLGTRLIRTAIGQARTAASTVSNCMSMPTIRAPSRFMKRSGLCARAWRGMR
jgi:GNAT superfamily N-acetyltransferase